MVIKTKKIKELYIGFQMTAKRDSVGYILFRVMIALRPNILSFVKDTGHKDFAQNWFMEKND